MKFFALPVLFSALLFAQPPAPPKVAPGTPNPAGAQAPAPPPAAPATIAPDTVILEVNGKSYTKAEVDKIIASLPPQSQQVARSQPQMLTSYFVMKQVADDAVKEGLDKQSPYKEALEFDRLQILARGKVATYGDKIQIERAEQEKFYQANPDRFSQAKVRVIYITFSPTPDKPGADGKKMLSEAQAKSKIDDLRKQVLAGGDFGKLARANSEDKTSAEKDGDFGIIKHNSAYPDPVKNAVFALKAGGVSEPVRQPNGFYLIRVDELTAQPFDEVSTEIFQELKQSRMNDYLKGIQEQNKVNVKNPAYFTTQGPAQLQQVR